MAKNKKFIIIILIAAFVGSAIYFHLRQSLLSDLKQHGVVAVSKREILLTVSTIRDYRVIEDPEFLWIKSEKQKMINYMKENNLLLKKGSYRLNGATSYEKALEIFEFEKNTQ
ncbi:hypothetical protein [Wukongibacter sp. M2B1]|uniref:hypothetical protein n=1 Tax=Wukongibacter sp. M2B1 TaxID=3088895 RepID=UPI003D7A29DD